jgi:hypothetical protein
MMRGLYLLGIFEWQDDGRFALTDLSQPLLSSSPESVRPGVLFLGQEQYRAWADLLQTVMTGEPAFQRLFGTPFDYYDQHPETGEAFDSWMSVSSRQVSTGILNNYVFPDAGTVVDVGGGEGVLLAGILQGGPELSGVLVERKSVIEKARRYLTAKQVIDRCRLVPGDFRQEVPTGGDIYILRNILHDWPDAGALQILTATRRAMKPSARLAIFQLVMPAGRPTASAAGGMIESDLMQMMYAGGRERTQDEYRDLLRSAGLEVTLTMQADGLTWLTEARSTTSARLE